MSAFDALDSNHDGVISRAEFAGAMGGGATAVPTTYGGGVAYAMPTVATTVPTMTSGVATMTGTTGYVPTMTGGAYGGAYGGAVYAAPTISTISAAPVQTVQTIG